MFQEIDGFSACSNRTSATKSMTKGRAFLWKRSVIIFFNLQGNVKFDIHMKKKSNFMDREDGSQLFFIPAEN